MSSKYIANSFQVPNAIVDEVMAKVSGNAFKCYMFVVRQTTGWNKVSDRISTTVFMKASGISKKPTVYKAIDELEVLNLIIVEKSLGEINSFRLNFDVLNQYQKEVVPQNGTSTPEGMGVVPQNGTGVVPQNGTLQNTLTKHTITKHNNKENIKESPLDILVEKYKVEKQLAQDWLTVRKDKNSKSVTETAIKAVIREAEKANLTLNQAIQVAIERNWVTFRYDWLMNKISKSSNSSIYEQNMANAQKAKVRLFGGQQ